MLFEQPFLGQPKMYEEI